MIADNLFAMSHFPIEDQRAILDSNRESTKDILKKIQVLNVDLNSFPILFSLKVKMFNLAKAMGAYDSAIYAIASDPFRPFDDSCDLIKLQQVIKSARDKLEAAMSQLNLSPSHRRFVNIICDQAFDIYSYRK